MTSLEMLEFPTLRPEAPDPNWRLDRLAPDPTEYRRLYRAVGEDWLWFSRLLLTGAELAAIIGASDVEVYRLTDDGDGAGLLELDFREKDECELAFFGLSRTLIGGPAGRWLMNRAIERAWSRPIRRTPAPSITRPLSASTSAPASGRSDARWRSLKIPDFLDWLRWTQRRTSRRWRHRAAVAVAG